MNSERVKDTMMVELTELNMAVRVKTMLNVVFQCQGGILCELKVTRGEYSKQTELTELNIAVRVSKVVIPIPT